MLLTSPSATSECISRANFLIDELLLPAVFPHHVTRLQTRETHISWVLLTGPFAYKIKKSVKFPFIDTTSLAKRRELCELELRLNRRFAPDIYVDVVAITREPAGLRIGGQGKIIEYAVRMKQFDESEELCSLLDRGAVDNSEIVDLAQRLAEFHGSAPIAVASADFKHTNALRDAVLGNLATLISHLNGIAGLTDLGRLSDWTHDFLHESIVHFRQREECGFIRECHGDLHARNVVRWQGQLLPFDCLEFDPALRWIDVMNDAAFLVMDLISHGRANLAYSFLNRYLETSGDYAGVRLLPFYAIYRALVRAMVDALAGMRSPQSALTPAVPRAICKATS